MALFSDTFSSMFTIATLTSVAMVTCNASNILMVFDKPGTSHFHDAAVIATLLNDKGHNITFLLPEGSEISATEKQYESKFSFVGFRKRCKDKIHTPNVVQMAQDVQIKGKSLVMQIFELPLKLSKAVVDIYTESTEDLFCDTSVADTLMTSNFNLILFEGSFLWLHALIQKFDIPYAMLTTSAASSQTNSWIHAPNLPAVVPGFIFRSHHRQPMSFYWRTYNALMIYGSVIFFTIFADEAIVSAASCFYSTPLYGPTRSFGLADVWLTNTDHSTDVPRPFMPNTALVGGLSIEDPSTLSEEFQIIIDSSGDDGLLIVSLGTVVKGISIEQTNAMAAAFARLPQTVVWKEPVPRPSFIGNNTILKKWIPQKDLIAHPKTRAMVYHCGNNGAFEALYQGVPIVAIPVFADQVDVAYRVMSNGMGLVIEPQTLTNETMFQAVFEVINNPKYRERAEHLSAVYRDNPDPAPVRAAFWIEYVLRHRGNRLMRAKVASMGLIQEYLLDVWACCICALIFIIILTKKIVSYVLLVIIRLE